MKWLAYRYLRLRGWGFEGKVPDLPKMIIVGAPHTSNWDFIAFLAALHHFRLKVRFLGKHTLFRWPFGYLFRGLGGIPVDRSRPGGIVAQVADVFDASHEMILVIAPEGTRKPAPYWKSGFIKMAEAARVPVVLAAVDYPRRRVVIGPAFSLDEGVRLFMDHARSFYADKEGSHPEGKGPVRVREEKVTPS